MRIKHHIQQNYLEYTIFLSILFVIIMAANSNSLVKASGGSSLYRPLTGSVLSVQKAEEDKSECRAELYETRDSFNVCNSRLSICQNQYTKLYANNSELSSNFNLLMEKAQYYNRTMKEYMQKFNESSSAAQKCFNKLERTESDLNTIISNAARNICCKQKVDDPSIDSYTIVENSISCVSGGNYTINCSG